MSPLYPLTFIPILSPKPWGGSRLASYGKQIADEPTGESWEIADLKEAPSAPAAATRIADGDHAGKTLSELHTELGDELGWTGRFPLLIKLLDAREHLSVQVHPDQAYVAEHPESHLKTESWYVMEAEPESVLYIGFKPHVTPEAIDAALGTAAIVDLMTAIPARSGDVHHLPAGTIHALGAGVLVAEVQTPSDTTFRIYDWTDEYDRQERQLHIAEAIATLSITGPAPSQEAQLDLTTRLLVETEHYWMTEHRLDNGESPFLDPRPGFRVVLIVNGAATVTHRETNYDLSKGSTVLLPADIIGDARVECEPGTVLLEIGA